MSIFLGLDFIKGVVEDIFAPGKNQDADMMKQLKEMQADQQRENAEFRRVLQDETKKMNEETQKFRESMEENKNSHYNSFVPDRSLSGHPRDQMLQIFI